MRGDERLDQLAGQRVELGRPVERQADAPRRRGRRAGPARQARSSWRVPPARPARRRRSRRRPIAMTGLRSTSRMSGRSTPRRPSATSIADDGRAVDRRPAADAVAGGARRAGRRASRRPPRRRSARGGSRRRRGPRSGSPPSPTSTAGPNCGSRRRPRISSTPGGAIGSTSSPRTVEAVAPAGLEQRRGRRRRPRRRRASPSATPPRSLLWASPTASSLSATGRPIRRAAATAVGGVGDGDDLGHRRSRRPPTKARLSRSDRRPAGGRGGGVGVGSAPYEVRSAASAGQPARHGPAVARGGRGGASQRATSAIARNAATAPRRSGAPSPSSSSSAFVSGGGSPEVSDT